MTATDAPSLLADASPPARRPGLLTRTRLTLEERPEKGSPVRTQYDLTAADGGPPSADAVIALLEGAGLAVRFVPRVRLVPGDECRAPACGCQRWRPVDRGGAGRPKCSCNHPATTARAQKLGHVLVEE